MNFRVLHQRVTNPPTTLITNANNIADAVLTAIERLGARGFKYARCVETGEYYKIVWGQTTYRVIPVMSYQGKKLLHQSQTFNLPTSSGAPSHEV